MSAWYAAHLIMYVKYTKHTQRTFPLFENVILISAESEEEAFAKAERCGQARAGKKDAGFTWDGKPATWVFGGVRKLTLCEDAEERPGDGTEITYTEMQVGSCSALRKLIEGEPVEVTYRELFRE